MDAVVVDGLRKAYGEVCVLDGVSFTATLGEVFALVGPTGAGKSTTMAILRGHRSRDRGRVSVLDADPATSGWAHRRRIGTVAQQPEHDGLRTPRELLRFRARAARDPWPVDEVLAFVGLAPQRDVRLDELGLGDRRRVDLALALIGDPELLLLDEPMTAFDLRARRRFGELLAELCDLGKTVIITTSRVAEARAFADRVGVIADGRTVAVGTPADLAGGRPGGRGVIRFRLPEHVAGCDLPDAGHLLTIGIDRVVELRSLAPARDLQWLTRWASERAVPLEGLTIAPPSFEDAYLDLIGHA